VILGIEVTNVTTAFHQFFKFRLLVYKIRLTEEESAATAVSAAFFAFKSWALSTQSIPPESTLTDDHFHPFEPPWHCWVIIIEIK
jgi:hypothetical protein